MNPPQLVSHSMNADIFLKNSFKAKEPPQRNDNHILHLSSLEQQLRGYEPFPERAKDSRNDTIPFKGRYSNTGGSEFAEEPTQQLSSRRHRYAEAPTPETDELEMEYY